MTSGPAPRSALTTDRASDDLSPSVCDRFPEAQPASGISLDDPKEAVAIFCSTDSSTLEADLRELPHKTEFGIIGHSMACDRARTGLSKRLPVERQLGAAALAKGYLRLAGVSMQPLKIYNLYRAITDPHQPRNLQLVQGVIGVLPRHAAQPGNLVLGKG